MNQPTSTWIEFHDSQIRYLAVSEAGLVLSLYAVVHSDPNGNGPYTGWQEHRLLFKGFTFTCSKLEHGEKVDVYLSDGAVKVDGRDMNQLLASNAAFTGAIEVSLWPSPNFARLLITAGSLRVEPVGPLKWERKPPQDALAPSASASK
ncbi:hypothetical protein [Terriglobus aquaticus]|uniref:Uncharacterized protein n=1 Tax=Terriglobus aquaticus TaxID=940139 RepID=A0ABW9KFY2_9BACT|nr:hypothetical protein [Terriglobus aquaticus]